MKDIQTLGKYVGIAETIELTRNDASDVYTVTQIIDGPGKIITIFKGLNSNLANLTFLFEVTRICKNIYEESHL